MKKITLCGSTKFKNDFLEWNARLTLQGYLVYTVGLFGHHDKIELTKNEKIKLDVLHFNKIDNSDGIFVIDVDNYVGESTHREIEYAKSKNKDIRFLTEEFPKWSENDYQYVRKESK